MEYCHHVWAVGPSSYSDMLNKQQKRICKITDICCSPTSTLEPVANRRIIARLSLFLGITLVDVHLNWLIWFHFFIFVGVELMILTGFMIFLSPFLDVISMHK